MERDQEIIKNQIALETKKEDNNLTIRMQELAEQKEKENVYYDLELIQQKNLNEQELKKFDRQLG